MINLVKKAIKFLKAEYYILFQPQKTFVFDGVEYKYFYHKYNYTPLNERCVEIPIVMRKLDEYLDAKKQVFEIGNVMQNYHKREWEILDKFEKEDNVINKDIVDYKTDKRYDLIICVSTIEHIGFDDNLKDDDRISSAILNMKNMLKKDGELIITFPLGYNPNADKLVEKNWFDKITLMRKVKNKWKEDKVLKGKYGDNVVILTYKKNGRQ